jgi:hypothetical protein
VTPNKRCRYSYLNTEVATVYVVAQEEVARLRWVAADFEQLHEIVVLPVNVTADRNGRIHLEHVWLRLQDLCALPYDP